MKKIMILLLSLFLLLGACTATNGKTPLLTPEDPSSDGSQIDLDQYAEFRELRFSLPSMDKEMCETYPRLILGTLEGKEGVLDASFNYSGHIVIVTYVPTLVTEEELLAEESYAWIGTVKLTDEIIDRTAAEERLSAREENNALTLPAEHMADGYTELTPEVLNAMLEEKDFVLVDVHIPEQDHIPGTDAVVPFDDIEALEAALPDKEAKVVLYCRSGRMSSETSAALASRGYTNLYNLEGGLKVWQAEGYGVEAR